ncbi:hypothetical protein [Methanosphaera sp.]|jgi:hypothetical protein|uniref:hypothetical protein n=1 Tax=Methanosphaera sp. TaxID=2666342 RepID=UPI003D93A1DA
MPRKTKKDEEIKEAIIKDVPEPQIDENTPEEPVTNGGEEPMDIMDYLNEPNLRLGIDYRKKIEFRLDGHNLTGIIRPLSSDEVARVNNTSEMGQGALDKLVTSIGFYGANGKTIPLSKLDKFPAGVTSYIATEIMSLSGYNIGDEATQYLKKP